MFIVHKIIEYLGIKSRNTQDYMKQGRKLLKDKDIVSYTIGGRVHFYSFFGRQPGSLSQNWRCSSTQQFYF